MKNKDNIPQFVNSDSFMADKNYVKWLSDLKKRFRMAQLKAAVKVNTEMLKFYWSLGEDICEKQKQYKWGAKVVDRLSLDMRSEIPQSEGFSRPLPCKTLICVLFKSNWKRLCHKFMIHPLDFSWCTKKHGILNSVLFFAFIFNLVKTFTIHTDNGTLTNKGMRIYLADKTEDSWSLTLLG